MNIADLDAKWTEERDAGEGVIRVTHIPNGYPITAGLTFHQLEQWNGNAWVPMARVNAVLTSYRATPVMAWTISAPGTFKPVPELWLSCRAFANEGDGIDALWRLHDLFVAGEYPADIRDAV